MRIRHGAFPLLLLLVLAPPLRAGETLKATAAVEKDSVFLGEPFRFQIRVEGTDQPAAPDLSPLRDFEVKEEGGQVNNSESISIINGRMSRTTRRGYVFSYRLVPKRTGTLTIPPLVVEADGHSAQTGAVAVRVKKPEPTDDLRLRIELSDPVAYVGQAVTLEATWYVAKEVKGFSFRLPLAEDPRFAVAPIDDEVDPDRHRGYLAVPVGDLRLAARRGRTRLGGKPFLTLAFRLAVIPLEAGDYALEPATVTCNALVGRQPASRFDSFFFGGERGVYDTFVVPSDPIRLKVRPLPEEGRPPNFAGLVGRYEVEAGAEPTALRVGDPLTLRVQVRGPAYLENVTLPPLTSLPRFAQDFKIPSERGAGEIEGRVKTFTQTLRPRRANVSEIPPVELPYFDVSAGAYRIARSRPIPLEVEAARVVTAADVEGGAEALSAKSAVHGFGEGIAHNYAVSALLRNEAAGPERWKRDPAWWALFLLPPLAYGGLFLALRLRRHRRAGGLARRQAAAALRASLAEARDAADVYEALRRYLGARLRRPAGAITLAEAREALAQRGVSPEGLHRLETVFAAGEAARYGAGGGAEASVLGTEAEALARELDRKGRE